MTAHGVEFLETWIEGNVTEADKYGSKERAIALATICLAEAKALGITPQDMESDAGSLETIIYEKMHHGFDG